MCNTNDPSAFTELKRKRICLFEHLHPNLLISPQFISLGGQKAVTSLENHPGFQSQLAKKQMMDQLQKVFLDNITDYRPHSLSC